MSSITKRRTRWVAAPLLAAASIAMASPAFAATFVGTNSPTVVQAVQGSTATLYWTYRNDGVTSEVPPSGGTITFNAPAGTTFPAQSTVPTAYAVSNGPWQSSNATLTGCTVGGGGTTLACNIGTVNGANKSWLKPDWFQFAPQVTVGPAATPGTSSAAASMQWTEAPGASAAGTVTTITNGTLDVNIVQAAATPMVDPLVGLGAGALVLGTGAAVVLNRRRRADAGL